VASTRRAMRLDRGGQDTLVTCFYFGFAARKEKPAASIFSLLQEQAVGGIENIPEAVFQEQKNSIGRR